MNVPRAYHNAREAFRTVNQFRKRRKAKREARRQGIPIEEPKEVHMFPKGTQTLSGIAVLILVPWAADLGISSEQVTTWVTAVGTVIGGIIAVFGYLRRKKMPAE